MADWSKLAPTAARRPGAPTAKPAPTSRCWKLLGAGEDKYLFDLESDEHETRDLLIENPAIAQKLETKLRKWASDLDAPGLPTEKFNPEEKGCYDHYMSQ